MPLWLLYIRRNLTRNPIRVLLTLAAVGLPIMVYVLSFAVVDGVGRFLDNAARQLRLAVTHKVSLVNPLPIGYRRKIESLDPTGTRMIAVCGMRFMGGRVDDDRTPLSTIALDADTFPTCFPEYLRRPEQRAEWLRDRRAIVVGKSVADRFGWQVGELVTIQATLPPYAKMQFKVVATSEDAADPVTNWCRLDYLEEELKRGGYRSDFVSFLFVKCASQADVEYFRAAIDELFAAQPDQTQTQDEKTFMNQFIQQQFNLPRNLRILALVTVFVAVMAAANTMSMNFRDRLAEFATLKAIGFGGRAIFVLIQTESLLLCALGGALGAGVPYVLFEHTPLGSIRVPVIEQIRVRPETCAAALGIGLLVGLLAALAPSVLAARMRVVHALRTLE